MDILRAMPDILTLTVNQREYNQLLDGLKIMNEIRTDPALIKLITGMEKEK